MDQMRLSWNPLLSWLREVQAWGNWLTPGRGWRDEAGGQPLLANDGVEFGASDHHEGLRQAVIQTLPEAVWQRCYVHFLRNALDHLPRKADDDCLKELRWIYDWRDLEEARRDLSTWLAKWQGKYPKLCDWVEQTIEETLSFYRLPLAHHKHLKSTSSAIACSPSPASPTTSIPSALASRAQPPSRATKWSSPWGTFGGQ